MRVSWAIVVWLCVVLSWGGAAQAQTPPAAPQQKQGFSLKIPNDPSQPAAFSFNGQEYSNLSGALSAARDEFRLDLDKVKPQERKLSGQIRVVYPTMEAVRSNAGSSTNGRPEVAEGFAGYQALIDEIEVQAIKRADMFERTVVERLDVAVPSIGNFDYVLWKDNRVWYLATKTLPGQYRVQPFSTGKAVGFVSAVSQAIGSANDPKSANSLRTFLNGASPTFEFRGVEYRNQDALTEAMSKYFLGEAQAVKPARDRLCGKGKVVIATQRQSWRMPVPGTSPEALKQADAAGRVYSFLLNTAKGVALRESKIFDSIQFQVADTEDVAPDDFDWVIWQRPSNGTWRFRVGAGDAYNLVASSASLDDWVSSVYGQLSGKRDPVKCLAAN